MGLEDLPDTLGDVLWEDSKREVPYGEYHPSTINGCPLKAFFKKMAGGETELNRWLFNGSAVHHYLQETGKLTRALHRAGFHPLDVDYEVSTRTEIDDEISIVGRCDILAHENMNDGDPKRTIIDIKYSSIPAHSNHGRLYMYAAQANTYAQMFNADRFALLLINSKSDHIPDDIAIISHASDEETWEITVEKARQVHSALNMMGYSGDEMWDKESLIDDYQNGVDSVRETMQEVLQEIDKSHCPSYEKECQYCDFKKACPVYQGDVGGLRGMSNG